MQNRNHLTEMLPSFRLASAGSDEDMLSSNTDLDRLSANYNGSEDDINFLSSPNEKSPNKQSVIDFSGIHSLHENYF